MATKKRWIPLESNPDVMNQGTRFPPTIVSNQLLGLQFMWGLGVPEDGTKFNDVYGPDDELLEMVPKPVLAVLFLYPYADQMTTEEEE